MLLKHATIIICNVIKVHLLYKLIIISEGKINASSMVLIEGSVQMTFDDIFGLKEQQRIRPGALNGHIGFICILL